MDLHKSTIDYVYGCDYNTIESQNIESWKIVKNSAKCEENETLYFDTSYKIAEKEGQTKNKFLNWFLKESIGYGYKPGRAIRFVILTIVGFGLLYSVIDLVYYLINGYQVTNLKEFICNSMYGILKRVYFSGITFTTVGYGDITPTNIITKLLAVLEACLGVSIFSLLIYAITKRHLDN